MWAATAIRGWMVCLVGAGMLMMPGCGTDGPPADAAQVQGTVTYQGNPVEGATVTFRSDSGSAGAGKTDAQGVYRIRSADIPGGIKPGTYQIAVKKMEAVEGGLTEEDPNYGKQPQSRTAEPKNLLPEKYATPRTSGLEATVKAGENEVPLELAD